MQKAHGQSASTAKRPGVFTSWLVLVVVECPGNWLSAKDKCAPKGQECPCGENSVRCALAKTITLFLFVEEAPIVSAARFSARFCRQLKRLLLLRGNVLRLPDRVYSRPKNLLSGIIHARRRLCCLAGLEAQHLSARRWKEPHTVLRRGLGCSHQRELCGTGEDLPLRRQREALQVDRRLRRRRGPAKPWSTGCSKPVHALFRGKPRLAAWGKDPRLLELRS